MKRVFSGIQPTGIVHIGNLLGALRTWVAMQSTYECVYCIVDLHALTTPQKKEEFQHSILHTAATCVAVGVDPEKVILFQQSMVPEHTELTWLLNCFAYFGELRRMTQFKEKAGAQQEASTIGLLDYPILMASDILLYQAAAVPVGDDQKQHLELCRTIARRVNNIYGDVFTIPEPIISTIGARIMGLDDPTTKMSKSAPSEYNYIALTDTPEVISRKVQFAVTDSGKDIMLDEERKPAISNLLTIYHLMSGIPIPELQQRYMSSGYAPFKKDLADAVIAALSPIQKRLADISQDISAVKMLLTRGAEKARVIAGKTLSEFKSRIGIGAS